MRAAWKRVAVAAPLGAFLLGQVAIAQPSHAITVAGYGSVDFPTSTRSAVAQREFSRGVLLLHLFHYDEAADAFRAAERADSGFAMAYWGEAMTFTHAVWDEQDTAAGRRALGKLAATPEARERAAPTARERGYMRALDALYGDGPKAKRDTLFSDQMAEVSRANPHDDEARLFYALSLMGLSQGVRNIPTYLHAAQIAESVFARHPNEPAAAHYWIHAMDDPDHAAQALPAARALSHVAPDAAHAQHMTSHIFMALGMWDEMVLANENTKRMVDAMAAKQGAGPFYCGHGNSWLAYGYVEQGRRADAKRMVTGCEQQATRARYKTDMRDLDPDLSAMGSAVGMWVHYVIDTEDWSGDMAQWAPDLDSAAAPRAAYQFGRAFAAARRGDGAAATEARAAFEQERGRLAALVQAEHDPDPSDAEYVKGLAVLGMELEAVTTLAAHDGSLDSAGAATLLTNATATEDSLAYAFGPPPVYKPSHELLGELLVGLKRYGEAERQFRAALAHQPRRVLSLRGLAAAAEGAGDTAAASRARGALRAIQHFGASPDADP
ncbi:MAG TPA: hypothetical protein VIC24_12960 [Gemmatimonadaceae bacterium]|jgi:hypothetical protein